MARAVRLTQTDPLKINPAELPQDKPLWICRCGLSQKFPFCDGSHKIARSEEPGKLYVYSADAKQIIETREDRGTP